MPKWVICDLDGTLADVERRAHFAKQQQWDAFHEGIAEDPVKGPVAEVVRAMWAWGRYNIALITGRPERYREVTTRWLRENNIPYTTLLMRPDDCMWSDVVLKRSHLNVMRSLNQQPILAIEDRDKVVEMWRQEGIITLQVQKGDY